MKLKKKKLPKKKNLTILSSIEWKLTITIIPPTGNILKLLINPDLYFGEAYMDGSLVIENGSLTDFLDIALKNVQSLI